MTTPAQIKLVLYQGATFRHTLTWKTVASLSAASVASGTPVDLTGCTARMQIRSTVKSPTVLVTLTTENSGLTLGGILGTIAMYISDTQTTGLAFVNGVWDLEIRHPTGDVTRVAEGKVLVSPEVTRA